MSEQKKRALSQENLASMNDREYVVVEPEVWAEQGLYARLQSMSALEVNDFIEEATTDSGYRVIARCLVDDDGQRVFPYGQRKSDQHAEAKEDLAVLKIKNWNPKAVTVIAERAMELNNLTTKVADVKNGSGEAPADASPTDSQ